MPRQAIPGGRVSRGGGSEGRGGIEGFTLHTATSAAASLGTGAALTRTLAAMKAVRILANRIMVWVGGI
jgi:hypothetical protein